MANTCPNCHTEVPAGSTSCPLCITAEPAVSRDPLVGKVIGGRYRIVRPLGRGGMGVVYEAEHVGVGQKVAIKFLHPMFSSDPDLVRRFHNEARSYGQLNHPHAVQLHDFGQDDDGTLFISMELVDGCDLKRTLARDGRLPPKDALDVTLQVCEVLAAAHARGIVHRDLKPENIMLTRELRGWHVKVLDFGLAFLAESGSRLSAPGTVCGTPRYMSPEQADGGSIDHRTDVYALGLVLFESVTGVNPFDSPSVTETLGKQRSTPVPRLAQTAPDLAAMERIDAAIQKATAKRREDRFASMLDFARALSEEAPSASKGSPPREEVDATSVRPSPVPQAPQQGSDERLTEKSSKAGKAVAAPSTARKSRPTQAPATALVELEPYLAKIERLAPQFGRASSDLVALVGRARIGDHKGVLQSARLVLETILRSLVNQELK
ncbi:MAG: protein kinase, partial [Deltaproteobacteria bacterium]|nr:protein kinase [Deltaproteobacteria bacterium]